MIIKHDPKAQLIHQLNAFYPNAFEWGGEFLIESVYDRVLQRLDDSFSHVKNKYYHNDKETIFDPLHVAQWTMFLYTMANEIFKSRDDGCTDICDRIYGLSKIISSADIYYAIEMPKIWFFDHPQGSVMGRAEYGDFFTFTQCCTVGNNKGLYPHFSEHVSMFSGAKVLGNCHVGDHVIFSANSYIIDQDVPSFSIVFGMGKNVTIKSIDEQRFKELTCSMF